MSSTSAVVVVVVDVAAAFAVSAMGKIALLGFCGLMLEDVPRTNTVGASLR
jgi:hypothetical protein